MRIMSCIAIALFTTSLTAGCGMFTGRTYRMGKSATLIDVLLPAPKAGDTRVWTEATLTSVETGEQTTVPVQPPAEPGAPQYLANVAEGRWHLDLLGVDQRTGDPVRYSLQDVYVEGDPFVLEIEAW